MKCIGTGNMNQLIGPQGDVVVIFKWVISEHMSQIKVYFLWYCFLVNAPEHLWWKVSIGSGDE